LTFKKTRSRTKARLMHSMTHLSLLMRW